MTAATAATTAVAAATVGAPAGTAQRGDRRRSKAHKPGGGGRSALTGAKSEADASRQTREGSTGGGGAGDGGGVPPWHPHTGWRRCQAEGRRVDGAGGRRWGHGPGHVGVPCAESGCRRTARHRGGGLVTAVAPPPSSPPRWQPRSQNEEHKRRSPPGSVSRIGTRLGSLRRGNEKKKRGSGRTPLPRPGTASATPVGAPAGSGWLTDHPGSECTRKKKRPPPGQTPRGGGAPLSTPCARQPPPPPPPARTGRQRPPPPKNPPPARTRGGA